MSDQVVLLAGDVPALAADGRGSPEEVLGIDLLLDLNEAVVVAAVEGLRELRVHQVTLIEVATRPGRDVFETLAEVVGQLLVNSLDFGLGAALVPHETNDAEHHDVAPGRVDGAIRGIVDLVGVDVVVDEESTLLDDATESLDGGVAELLVLPVLLRHETRCSTGSTATDGHGREVVQPSALEGLVLEELKLGVDTESLPVVKKRLNKLFEIHELHAGDHERLAPPRVAAVGQTRHAAVAVGLVRRVVGVAGPVGLDGLPEGLIVDAHFDSGGVPGHTGEDSLLEDTDGHGSDDTPGCGATATHGPEEVGILLLVGSDEATVRSNDVDGQNLVGSHTIERSDRGVTTAGEIATGDTDSAALTTNSIVAVLLASSVHLVDHDTGTHLESRALVATTSGLVVLDHFDVVEVVSPKGQSTSTGVLSEEVVASVANDKTDVEVTSEVDGELDLGSSGDVERVLGEATNSALSAGKAVLGLASGALEQRRHEGRRVVHVSLGDGPVLDEVVTLGLIVVLTLVASSTEGNRFDQGASREDVEDLPDGLARIQQIARQTLTLRLEAGGALLWSVIIKVEDRDIAEVKTRQVGERLVRQLDVFKARERASVGRDDFGGRSNIVVVGGWGSQLQILVSCNTILYPYGGVSFIPVKLGRTRSV